MKNRRIKHEAITFHAHGWYPLCRYAGDNDRRGTKDNTPVVATIDGEDVHSSELAAYIVYNMMYYENSFGMDVKSMASVKSLAASRKAA